MKQSPLQLKWISYPSASYEIVEEYDPKLDEDLCEADVAVSVVWDTDNEHMATLTLTNNEASERTPYKFAVSVAALFTIDMAIAKSAYSSVKAVSLPPLIAVNIARILYSGAREHIAMMTARGPNGPLKLKSVLIEATDVKIGSTVDPHQILRDIFEVPESELKKLTEFVASRRNTPESAESQSGKKTRRKTKEI